MDVRQALDAVRERHGALTPQAVVNDARPDDAPLHDRFEWDDRVAGERYRVEQARELIRSVRIVFHEPGDPIKEVRGYVSVDRPHGREYVPLEEARDDPLTRAIVLRDAEREWRALYQKYRGLEEFLAIVREAVAS